MQLQQEILYMVMDEAEYLLKMHYQELTLNKEHVMLAPDWERYADLEKQGNLIIFTARDEGRLVGYSAFFINSHIHYKNNLFAINDVLFLHPDYRNNSCGARLIKYSDQELSKLGKVKILWHVKVSRDFRPILHRLGYVDEEIICGKMAGIE